MCIVEQMETQSPTITSAREKGLLQVRTPVAISSDEVSGAFNPRMRDG
jgi:hypothetical protein